MKVVAASSAHLPPCPILLEGATARRGDGQCPSWHLGYAGVYIARQEVVAGAGSSFNGDV